MGGELFGIGFGELLFLAILVLVIFGPKRIPEIARTIGRALRQLREATAGMDREVRQMLSEQESRQGSEQPLPTLPPSPLQFLSQPEQDDQPPEDQSAPPMAG